MKYINENMKLKEIVEKYPETLEFFSSKGFKGLDKKETRKIAGNVSLKLALTAKKINSDTFINAVEDLIDTTRNSSDVTLSQTEKKEDAINATGLLPCPVRIPLLEAFKDFEQESNMKINYDLKAASSGLDWLKESIKGDGGEDKLSDIFISAGFDLFFEDKLMGKFKKNKIFKDISGLKKYNKDFEELSLKDPHGDYSMIAVVPAVFLINTEVLGDRPFPKTWEDILKPEFEKSVSLPVSDFDLFNAILLNIHKKFGDDGVRKLGRSLLQSLHPAQMVKSNKSKIEKPAITIMPYFFTKMTGQGGPMVAQWPEDGAIISPIFMLTKRSKEDELKKISEFFSSEKVARILSHQGLFPSVNPNIDNKLGDKKFIWLGWDYIYSNDIGKLIDNCESLFEEGTKEV